MHDSQRGFFRRFDLRRSVLLGAGILLVAMPGREGLASDRESEEPKKLGLKESVKVSLVQLEVTVWPKKRDSDACLGLAAADFELLVDNKPQEIYAVDALGSAQETYMPEAIRAGETSGGGLSIVLFFDLWHLDMFYREFPACPISKPLAFNEARKFVREQFRDGDRLLLVTAAGWPVIHYGWIRSRAEALRALDRLETNRQVVAPRQEHSHHFGWIAGLESLFLALGRYPGRKDVIYLGEDFRFDDVAMRMYEIAARAQSNGVVVSAVDLVDSCRKILSPPCVDVPGGLGCTPFSDPVALSPLSLDTGGRLFHSERIGAAVSELRSMRKCRYLISFRKEPYKRKHAPSLKVNLRAERTDLSLSAPSSFQTPEMAPSQKDRDEALFLLPRFGKGIAAEVALWPYRPTGKHRGWKAFALVRVERTDDEPWPDDLTELTVSVLAHEQSTLVGEYRKKITGDELQNFRTGRQSRLLLFPVDEIRPGDVTVDLTVLGNVEEISANVRRSLVVPTPPGPGEARPWLLSDRLVRFGEQEVLAPALEDAVTGERPLSFMAFGCHPKSAAAESYSGRLVPSSGGPPLVVPVAWLDSPNRRPDGCGWLVGRVESPLPPGIWTFEPPAALTSRKEASPVEFTVVSTTPSSTLPAEVRP